VATLQENCTSEYTLTAMLAGTCSMGMLVSQGAVVADPKASSPITVTLVGTVMLVRTVHWEKVKLLIVTTLVGMMMLIRPVQDMNASLPIVVTRVGMPMLHRLVQD
jgi:hypothetical protein